MNTSGAHRARGLASAVVFVVACGGTDQTSSLGPGAVSSVDAGADAGPDAGSCPKPDGGRIQVTRRGCPTTLEIEIK